MRSKINLFISVCGGYLPLFHTLLLSILVGLFPFVPGNAAPNDSKPEVPNVNPTDILIATLFANYDNNVPPLVDGQFTQVKLGLSVNYIDIDEMNGKVTLHCWLNVRWMDDRRGWNKLEFDNITTIRLETDMPWKPKITLFNAAGGDGDFLTATGNLQLSSNGSFLWMPPAVYTAYCNLNMRNWPYDKQICKLQIGSWSSNHISPEYTPPTDNELMQSTEWKILSAQTQMVQHDNYNYVEYAFTLQRSSSMYTAIIYTPASCIILLALCAFWLPPQMGEKILLNGLIILIIAAFLMYFAQLVPILGSNTPLIVMFYSLSLLLVSISTIFEVLVLFLSTSKHKRRLPDFLRKVLNGQLGSFLLLSKFACESEMHQSNGKPKELEENLYENSCDVASVLTDESIPSERALQFDWILLATAVDRICFLGYSFSFAVLAIVYSV